MFIRQKLLKHECTENVADIVFFIVYKVSFTVASKGHQEMQHFFLKI